MKKLQFILIILITTFLLSSCGGSAEKKETQEDKQAEKSEKLDLKTKDGVITTLKRIDIEIPSEFSFVEAKLEGSEYKSQFITDSLSQETFDMLNTWVSEQKEIKLNAGWRQFIVRENEDWAGSIVNEATLSAPKNTEIDGITITTWAATETKIITLYFSIKR